MKDIKNLRLIDQKFLSCVKLIIDKLETINKNEHYPLKQDRESVLILFRNILQNSEYVLEDVTGRLIHDIRKDKEVLKYPHMLEIKKLLSLKVPKSEICKLYKVSFKTLEKYLKMYFDVQIKDTNVESLRQHINA